MSPLELSVEEAVYNAETYIPFINYLLEKKADINGQDCMGNTSIIKSVIEGNKRITQLLVDRKANPLIQNLAGADAFTYLKSPSLQLILQNGLKNASLDQQLFHALDTNKLEDVKNLIEKEHANIHAKDQKKRTPLMHAFSLPVVSISPRARRRYRCSR